MAATPAAPASRPHASVVGASRPLHLHIKTVRKDAGQPERQVRRTSVIAFHEGLPHWPRLGPGDSDQPFAQLLQPLPGANGLGFDHVAGPGARQQFRQIQVTLVPLHQQQYARRRRSGLAFHEYFGAQNRLDALAAHFLVKLDGTEKVAEIGNGQCGLAILGRCLGQLIDAIGAVNDGELGVQAKVNKHGPHCRKPHLVRHRK